jgi:magnesium-transporting ATPase (P-type)
VTPKEKGFSMDNPWVWLLFGIILLAIGTVTTLIISKITKKEPMKIL